MQTDDGGSVLSTIDDKLNFLKQTLACELDKMSVNCTHHNVTITPSQCVTTSTPRYSHPHTLTGSTTSTAHNQHNTLTRTADSNEDLPKHTQLHMPERATNDTEGGLRENTIEPATRRDILDVTEGRCDGGVDKETQKKQNESASGSMEPDSVQFVSCSFEEMDKEVTSEDHITQNKTTAEGGCGGNLEREPRGRKISLGEDEDGGSGSESDMEVPRGAVGFPELDFSQLTDARAVSPLTISPGMKTAFDFG